MDIFDQLMSIQWPDEFVVEYTDGAMEHLLRGEGVTIEWPGDDPDGIGAISASIPKRHLRHQQSCGRRIGFDELRAVYTTDGQRFWP